MERKHTVSVKEVPFDVTVPEKYEEHFFTYGLRIALERATAGKGEGMTAEARKAVEGLISRIEDGTYTPGSGGGGKAPSVDRIAREIIRGNVGLKGTTEQKRAFKEIADLEAAARFYVTMTGGSADDAARVAEVVGNARTIAQKRIDAMRRTRSKEVTL